MTDSPHRIEHMALSDLLDRRHPRNPKDHDLVEIERSFERFGFANPVLLCERTGMLAAGHGRLEALRLRAIQQGTPDAPGAPRWIVTNEDGGAWGVPTVRGWASADDDELLAYVLTDNRLGEKGGWLPDPLAAILQELADTPLGLPPGYDSAEVDRIIAEAALVGGRLPLDDGSEWDAALPDYLNRSMESQFHTSIHFPTEADRDEFFRLIERPYKARWWWPKDDGHIGADWADQYVAVPEGEDTET